MKFPHKQLKGVTLVELLVVLMILVVLAGITITIINPARQRTRAQDGALTNAITGIAQTIETVHGIRGYYPSNSVAHRDEVATYISPGYTVTRVTAADCNAGAANCGLTFANPAITAGGVAGGNISYYIPKTGANTLPCLQARSNEDPAVIIAWAPGYGVTLITANCHSAAGWADLITP